MGSIPHLTIFCYFPRVWTHGTDPGGAVGRARVASRFSRSGTSFRERIAKIKHVVMPKLKKQLNKEFNLITNYVYC
jgi:hypothetical protein